MIYLQIVLIVASLIHLSIAQITSNVCIFKGCNCVYSGSNGYDVFCIYDKNKNESFFVVDQFPERDETSNYTNINTLLVKKFKFKTIPNDTFTGLTIKNLIIGENELEKITENAFRGIVSLNLIRIIEKKLDFIEPKAMEWLNDKLIELGLWQINFKSENIDQYFNELKCLKSLKTLKLMGYGIKKFRSDWLDLFKNISSLSLASNDLTSLQNDLFASCSNLISLDLSNNMLDDLNDTFATLAPIRDTLKDLKLNGNSIEVFVDFPSFPALEILDLSNNKIKTLNEKSFANLPKLSHLYLSDNSVNSVDFNTFSSNENLLVILLNNNYLPKIPSISKLFKLQILDFSNQNKRLETIGDYSFERTKIPANPLNLNLESNDIISFGNKTFCSRNFNLSEITQIAMSYNAIKNLGSKCIFKQINSLISSKIILRVGQSNDPNYNTVCNCDFKAYLTKLNIELTGVCETLVSTEKCMLEQRYTNETIESECSKISYFDCNTSY